MVQSQALRAERLKIGQLAARAGVSVDTVRFYERQGLLPEAARLPSGYRVFSSDHLDRVVLIKRLQALGMTLAEIRGTLQEQDAGDLSCDDGRQRLELVLDRIDREIARLVAMRTEIEGALDRCARGACDLG